MGQQPLNLSCWHGLAAVALDSLQDVVKKGAKGSSVLA